MDFACARSARLGGGNTSEVLSQMGGCHELQLHDVTFCARRRTTYRLENTVRDSTDLDSQPPPHLAKPNLPIQTDSDKPTCDSQRRTPNPSRHHGPIIPTTASHFCIDNDDNNNHVQAGLSSSDHLAIRVHRVQDTVSAIFRAEPIVRPEQ